MLTLEKKIFPPFLPGFELATFRSESGVLTNKLSRLPDSFIRPSLITKPTETHAYTKANYITKRLFKRSDCRV